ncbi:Flavodoxin domain-containing protein [Lachnospiraceae bacterium NK3A20]|nr:Flavodoxin domain-containing protein [Lachnospiraceae bacterium NK3A20]
MIAVRYYSRSGNTKLVADAIAAAVGTQAVSVDASNAALAETADVLFIGGALYAYGLDGKLKSYLESLDASKVKKAVVFSTSWLSRHALDLIKKELSAKSISVESETFYVKNRASEAQLQEAAAFAKKFA